jgi:hypothetical protein
MELSQPIAAQNEIDVLVAEAVLGPSFRGHAFHLDLSDERKYLIHGGRVLGIVNFGDLGFAVRYLLLHEVDLFLMVFSYLGHIGGMSVQGGSEELDVVLKVGNVLLEFGILELERPHPFRIEGDLILGGSRH